MIEEFVQIAQAGTHPWNGARVAEPRLRYGVVKHPVWLDIPGAEGMDYLLPSAQKLHDSPRQPYKGASIPIYSNWWSYIRKINNDRGYGYARSIGKLLINIPYSDGETPKAECVTSGDNLVAWYENDPTSETYEAVRILSFSHVMDTSGLNPEIDNIFWYPHLFWRCTSYNRAGYTNKVLDGVDCYIPQIKQQDCWIRKENMIMKPSGWEPTLPIPYPFVSWLLE